MYLLQLTNATSIKSDSDPESDHDTLFSNDVSASTPQKTAISTPEKLSNATDDTLNTSDVTTSTNDTNHTQNKDQHNANITKESSLTESSEVKPEDVNDTTLKSDDLNTSKDKVANTTLKDNSTDDAGTTPARRFIPRSEKKSASKNDVKNNNNDVSVCYEASAEEKALASEKPKSLTTKEESQNFIQSEKHPTKAQAKSSKKIGRKILNFFRPKPKVILKSSEVSKNLILTKIKDCF